MPPLGHEIASQPHLPLPPIQSHRPHTVTTAPSSLLCPLIHCRRLPSQSVVVGASVPRRLGPGEDGQGRSVVSRTGRHARPGAVIDSAADTAGREALFAHGMCFVAFDMADTACRLAIFFGGGALFLLFLFLSSFLLVPPSITLRAPHPHLPTSRAPRPRPMPPFLLPRRPIPVPGVTSRPRHCQHCHFFFPFPPLPFYSPGPERNGNGSRSVSQSST